MSESPYEIKLTGASQLDLLWFALGDFVGKGLSRRVYMFAPDKRFVIKVDTEDKRYQNMREVLIWREVEREHHKLMKWFAPVEFCSPRGDFILMRRTKPVSVDDLKRRLKRAPNFFNDLKCQNWGELDGRIVCHDYGIASLALTDSKLTKCRWYGDST